MKRCPQCNRDYSDETLNYCLDDGERLLDGPKVEDATTENLPSFSLTDEAATQVHDAPTSQQFEPPSISRENIFAAAKSHKTVFLIVTSIVIVVLAGFMYGIYNLIGGGRVKSSEQPAASYKIQALTASGNIREAAISPDGKFLAYTENTGGKAGLWVKQIATNSNVPIVEPTDKDFNCVKFSPDGQYVYYGLIEGGYSATIFRVPTLGGASVSVIGDADGPLTFSPDGKQFAFERFNTQTTESALMIVNADGSGERKLASRFGHEYFSSTSLAWSPDGKLIAFSAANDQEEHAHVMAVIDVASAEIRVFGKRLDRIGHVVWLRDQSSILFSGGESGSNVPGQIWQISYPDGEAGPLTNDLNGYLYLTMTADFKELVAIQRETFASVLYSNSGDIAKAENISHGKHEGSWGMTLTPDGRVVYVSNISGATEIWIMNSDGSNARQLTNDGISKYTPAVSGDGRYIVFISEKGGKHIWRINLDGGQMTQLTNGVEDANPRCSPDGKWVVYDSFNSGKQLIYRVPVTGGEPQALTDFAALEPDISRDGKLIAIFYNDTTPEKSLRLGVIPFDGGAITKSFEIPQTVAFDNSPQWMPDGKGITFIEDLADRSVLWLQPLDGSARKQMTDFKQALIFRREWTRDGKQVAIVKGTETSDAVLITDFR